MQRKIRNSIMILVLAAFILISTTASPTLATGVESVRANGDSFVESFELSYMPQYPVDGDTVKVVISSNTAQNISDAYLVFSYKGEEDDNFSEPGNVPDDYQFSYDEEKTSMTGWIPEDWNQGGVTIKFWVEATLDGEDWLTSDKYTYTVVKSGSWVSDDFYDNLEISYSPDPPTSNDSVTVILTPQNDIIQINWASLKATFEQPDGPTLEGGGTFKQEGDQWQLEIPSYPDDTEVTFYVEALDMYGEKIISGNHSYTVGGEDALVKPLIVVYDKLSDEYVDGAEVVVMDSKDVVFQGETKNGRAHITTPLEPGYYTIAINYKGIEKTKNITLEGGESGESATFQVNLESMASLSHDMIYFPQAYLLIGIFAGIFLPMIAFWSIYNEKRQIKLALTTGDKSDDRLNGDGWMHKLRTALINETIDPEFLIPVGFFLTSLVGLSFIPFYPWWMILTLSVVVGAIAYKYPYNSLLILALLVTGAAAYQSPEFGLVFLIFSLLVLMASFFDWKFGFFVFAIVFLARFGPVFLLPVMSAILFSTYLALVSTAVSGLFIVLTSSSGNIEVFGLVPSAQHTSSFMLFSKETASDFTPSTLGSAFSSISSANGNIIMTVLSENFGASILPFIQILIWCVGIYMITLIIQAREPRLDTLKEWIMYPVERDWRISLGASAVLGLSPLIGLIYFDYLDNPTIMKIGLTAGIVLGSILLVLTAQGVAYMTKSLFREYYRNKLGITDVGTRIAEMTDLGETTFDDIGGLDEVKEEVKESILIPLLRPDISEKFGVETSKGVLLFGPIGCGKTMLMKSLATELDVEMINVKCGDVMSRWYGESEDKIMKLFKVARKRKPCIIFFDEIDTIAKKRDMYATDDVTPRLLSLLLSEVDGMDRAEGIIIVGSTNKPEMVDPALLRPGRFDKIIYVPTPDEESRREILKIHLKNKPLSKDIDLDEIAAKTEGFSGADIANLAKEAATQAMRNALDSGEMKPIDMKVFNNVLRHMTPSITPTMKEEYERTRQKYERKIHEFKKPEIDRGVTLSEIPNLKEQKSTFKNHVLYPLTKSEAVEKFDISGAKNVLFYGPKGCGKISLIKASLNDFGLPMRVVSGRELRDIIHEEGRGVIKMLFNEMRDMAPAVITITELEDLAGTGDSILGHTDELAFSSLVHLMEDIKMTKDLALVATSHYPSDLREILFERGRFEKLIYIPHPDINRRYKLLKKHLGSIPTSKDVDLKKSARMTKGYTSEDIKSAVEEAKINAVTLSKKEEPIVTQKLLEDAIKDTKPSLKDDMVRSSSEFTKKRYR